MKGGKTMLVFVRSARTVHGKRGEAKKWAIELTDYINAQSPEINCKVLIPRFGEMNRIYWHADFTDLETLDAWQKQMVGDEGYHKLRVRAQDLLSPGSIEDTVLTSLT
jgi:hypothetical protein